MGEPMAKDKKATIAARMRAAREAAGLSQGQVARKLKMHRPTISEIEAGRRTVTAEELPVFGKMYGVETWWLACAEPEEKLDADMAKYHLAARHLSKMKQSDFDRLMELIQMMRSEQE
jgi:transcriptional regulator with XRE-family HTH domain